MDEPPNDLVAEQAVLGACMFRHQAVDEVRALLAPEDFYRPAHETIYRAILALRAEVHPPTRSCWATSSSAGAT